MCGISCILVEEGAGPLPSPEQERRKLLLELEESLELIKHRGPDSRGQWISSDNRVALGHVRLSINDLSPEGAQPFHDPEGNIHAVVNGELYDDDRLRSEISQNFHYKFKGRSDCEIVIALYKHYGLTFLDKLRGEFSLCLYDARSDFFVAARDRYGIKPLFWTRQNGRLLIAAEAKAFLALGWKPEWDVKSIMETGWNHGDRTLFKGVSKILPGSYLTWQSGHLSQRPYWDISYPNKHIRDVRSEAEIVQGVRDRLLESIRLRLRADVPVGVYLSGGIDSSVIAGMVTHLVREQGARIGNARETERVSCFGIAFDKSSGFDESDIAERTADYLGVKFYKKHMDEQALAERFIDATWYCEHHNPDLNYVGKYALSEVPREHGFKVVLTGEGSDENFAGYLPAYLPDFLREPDLAWPQTKLLDTTRAHELEKTEQAMLDYYRSIGSPNVPQSFFSSPESVQVARRQLNNLSIPTSMSALQPSPSLFLPWTHVRCCPTDPHLAIAHNIDGRIRSPCISDTWHPLHSSLYVWSKGHLPNIFLTCLGDRTEMSHSVEARTPFLDHKFTEYVNGLAPSMKIRYTGEGGGAEAFVEKWVLREASRGFVTEEILKRKKHPYTAPTNYPPGGPMDKLLQGLLTKDKVEALGFVDFASVEPLLQKAFLKQDEIGGETGGETASAMRDALVVAQWVVIGERFGVKTAQI